MAMCSISQMEERKTAVDFTHHILINELSFISQSPGLVDQHLLFANAFSTVLWISIGTSFICIVSILFLFKEVKPSDFFNQAQFIYLVAICLNQCK